MHIERVRIRGIRGIRECRFPGKDAALPSSGWIVFAGKNGTGKTTLLQAIAAAALGPATTLTMLGPRPESWLGRHTKKHEVELRVDGQAEDRRDRRDVKGPFPLGARWTGPSGGARIGPTGMSSFVYNQFWEAASLGAEPKGWMLAGYGANRFSAAATSEADQLSRAAPRRAAVATLFRREATLYATNWWAGVIAGTRSFMAGGNFSPEDEGQQAALLADTLERLLSDGLLSEDGRPAEPGRDGHVRLRPEGIEAHKDGEYRPVAELGLGYETLTLFVADLVRQFGGFFGQAFEGVRSGPDGVEIPHSGIVLLDEAENHLHPQLQRRMGPWLTMHFPRVQFLVTTHSPFVCQSACPGGLFALRPGGSVEPIGGESFKRVVAGSVDDAVLTELFGLGSPFSLASERARDELGALEARMSRGEQLSPQEQDRRRELLSLLPSDPGTAIERMVEALSR